MAFNGQNIIPAIRNPKQLEIFLNGHCLYGVLLDAHIAQLKNLMELVNKNHKKILIHADLIQGLKGDDYSTEFLCQEFKPYGIISTRTNVITKAKQKGIVTVLRGFLIDSQALEKFYSIVMKVNPDYVEILPGKMPEIVNEVLKKVNIPILAGGFIRTPKDIELSLAAGATAVTTSNSELWDLDYLKR
ncbi:MAG: glycerol-3-phosphate responsive antiterminator [Bacillota bacterium]|nr:glycerol-3-phosphate responsive antiterminator [Bacillota bacterium]